LDIFKLLSLYNKLNLNIKFNAGIEFYKKEIINFIIPYLDTNNIKYKILSKEEIYDLIRKIRFYDNNYISDTSDDENIKLNNKIYNPRDYQKNYY
jgi:hypothetical protein